MSARHTTPAAAGNAWVALQQPVFRLLWLATLASNIGSWMFSAASGWLMTSLNADPLVVSLVQVANSLPLFLFALPAGALADVYDKRRLIVAFEILTTLFSAVFALMVSLHQVTPLALLVFLFLVGVLGALETPAWQAIVPLLVPQAALGSAVSLNSIGINISRVIGPSLAGVAIVTAGIALPFWLDAFSNLGVILVLLRWCPPAPPPAPTGTLPAEHIGAAIRTGVRYARYNHPLRATLVRTAGFFLFASAYWALLPLLARNQLHGGAPLYGLLQGAIGAGAIAGALLLPRARAWLGTDRLVRAGELGTAAALLLLAVAHAALPAIAACLLAGVSWIVVLATLNVSAQTVLPEWVRGRGLAVYVTVFFGTMSVGSALWGAVAQRSGLPAAHVAAAACGVLVLLLTQRWKLHSGPQADLTPSAHWPEPILASSPEQDAGPVMVTLEFRVSADHRAAFLTAMSKMARERRRDGAYEWNVFQDTADPQRYLETFLVDSWTEHLRQHRRVTRADRVIEQHVMKLLREPPRITHYIAAQALSAAGAPALPASPPAPTAPRHPQSVP